MTETDFMKSTLTFDHAACAVPYDYTRSKHSPSDSVCLFVCVSSSQVTMAESGKTFKSVIEKYSVPCLCETLQIFHHVDLSQFAPVNLSELLTNRRLQWRIGKRQSPGMYLTAIC